MKNSILYPLILTLLLVGCKSTEKELYIESSPQMHIGEDVTSLPAPIPASRHHSPHGATSGVPQRVIRNAFIEMEVESIPVARFTLDSIINANNAWVSDESTYQVEFTLTNSMTIRVPIQSLGTLVDGIGSLAKRISHKRVESFDITGEYIDVESRLSNLQKLEVKYQNLLRRTDSIEEILMIESKLNEVRTTIEATQGRLKYLHSASAYSTISLTMSQKLPYDFKPDASRKFSQRLKESIYLGWRGLVGFFLFILKLWPLWILCLLGWSAYIGIKRLRVYRIKRRKRLKKQRKMSQKKLDS